MTAFSSSNITFQDLYQITNLINGVEPGDAVAMRQLQPLQQDISTVMANLPSYLQSVNLPALLAQFKTDADLQNESEVLALIESALAAIPDAESRLASVAVRTVFQGPVSGALDSLASLGLTGSDSGDIDDANLSCVLIDSPIPGQTGVYQQTISGNLSKLNDSLFQSNLGYYTRFYVIESEGRPGREFAVTDLNPATGSIEVEEIPYTDEYTGLGPIVVSNLNRTVNLRFSALDFIVNAEGEFSLLPAMKSAIALIPGLDAAVAAMTVTVDGLSQAIQAQGQTITEIQGSIAGIFNKIAMAFAKVQHIFFENGVAKIQDANGAWSLAPLGLVQELAGGTADRAVYRINHNRGVMTTPTYAQSDALGNPKRLAAWLDTEDVSANSIDLWVEKYTTITVSFPAGLTAAAFTPIVSSFVTL